MSRHVSRVGIAAALAVAMGAGLAAAAGPPERAFVAPGFAVEKRIRADIGGDRTPDRVLVLVRRAPSGDGQGRARRLVLLKARTDGGYVQIGEGRRILLCTRCGGVFFGAGRTPVTVRVRAGVVIVEQTFGSRTLTDQRFRIRSEGAIGTRLIGVDVRRTDRLTGRVVDTSTNLLTGDRILTRIDPQGRRRVTRSTVPVRRIALEDVDRLRYP